MVAAMSAHSPTPSNADPAPLATGRSGYKSIYALLRFAALATLLTGLSAALVASIIASFRDSADGIFAMFVGLLIFAPVVALPVFFMSLPGIALVWWFTGKDIATNRHLTFRGIASASVTCAIFAMVMVQPWKTDHHTQWSDVWIVITSLWALAIPCSIYAAHRIWGKS